MIGIITTSPCREIYNLFRDDEEGGGATFSFGGVTVQRQVYSDEEDEPGLTGMDAGEFQYGYYGGGDHYDSEESSES